ncbi:hypothetical protein THTE_2555 [Thermogutta terrifontis]|uniref:Uncharacterized protein n=1 Tax=Thermogutta terrifontis TaxID=1331910 RepID=A0A286RGT0_9BACT|nr:hypothetical protein THTE_2555 [Thermogutta terrifontis]
MPVKKARVALKATCDKFMTPHGGVGARIWKTQNRRLI